MSFEIVGKLIEKFETQQVSDRFKKREFVILKEENVNGSIFSDHIKFQLIQDKCDVVDAVNLNDEIKVSFNIKGNKWEKNGQTSYFTNLDAWRVEKVAAPETAQAPSFEDVPFPSDDTFAKDAGSDDELPF